jgi:hypothetical protein
MSSAPDSVEELTPLCGLPLTASFHCGHPECFIDTPEARALRETLQRRPAPRLRLVVGTALQSTPHVRGDATGTGDGVSIGKLRWCQ